MRKVAMAASAGFVESNDFNSFWPDENKKEEDVPSWGATPIELRKKILAKLKSNG